MDGTLQIVVGRHNEELALNQFFFSFFPRAEVHTLIASRGQAEMKRLLVAAVLLISTAGFSVLLAGSGSISALSAAQASAGNTVTITNFQFSPKSLTVKAGSEVTWEVKEGTHNIIADKGSFESQTLSAGQQFSYKFEKPGTYRYYCSFHGSKGGHEMAGTVIVTK